MSLGTMPKVGVFVCQCGNQISATLDTKALCQVVEGVSGVVFTTSEAYPCSKDGQLRMQKAINEEGLERVLVAGCTPRLVRPLFEKAVGSAGIERAYVDIRDIREQCAYVHRDDPGAAQLKAANLIEMGVERLAAITPTHMHTGVVVKSALVIGSGLSGLATAISMADRGIEVTLVEQSKALGGNQHMLQELAQEQIAKHIEAVLDHPLIDIRLNAQIVDVSGQPGHYRLSISQGDNIDELILGAIVIATGAQPKGFADDHWYDTSRVKTLIEYSAELEATFKEGKGLALVDIVLIIYSDDADDGHSSQLNCLASIRQAILTKELNPAANVLVLFRHMSFGGAADRGADDLARAKELGVTFFRYQRDHPPVIGDATIDVYDVLTGEPVHIAYDRAVVALPFEPQDNTDTLAALLRLPQDEGGFIIEPRLRLRPGRYIDDGIFVIGGAHQPADTAEALFQAYITSARALRFLNQETVNVEAPVAEIEASLCTGCGHCVQVCPMSAINLEKRDGLLSLSEVNALRCIGCGNCVVVCPVKAIGLPGWNDAVILAQISAALKPIQSSTTQDQRTTFEPKVVALACEWSAYAAAELAGTRHLSYPPNLRIIRMNCSARFDPNLILWAFLNGADGVFLGACQPGECHYGTGNLFAKERVGVLKKQLAEHGFNPNRLRLEFLSGEDSEEFVASANDFILAIRRPDKHTT